MRYQLIVRQPGRGIATRGFDGRDRDAAVALARGQGLEVLGVAGRTPRAAAAPARRERFDDGAFAEDLGALLQAGLGMLEAIEAMAGGDERGARTRVLQRLAACLREGRTLSTAMDEAGAFPAVLVGNVRASERTGHLVEALQRHAQYARSVAELRASLAAAATYPLVLLGVGALVVAFLLGYVIPRFAVLLEASNAQLPWSSRLLLSFGSAVAAHPQLPLALLLALAAVVGVALVQWRRGRGRGWLRRLPLVGPLVRAYQLAQTYRTAGLLVRGGVPAVQAMLQCAHLLEGRDRAALERAAGAMREGVALSRAMTEAGLADEMTSRMLVVAERTGTLPEVLDRIAGIQDTRLQRAIRAASRLAEPVLMIVIGAVIGGIVVLMYLPIFDLAAQLQ